MDAAEQAVVAPVPEPSRSAPDTSKRVCVITIGGEVFAIDLRHVREVFEVEAVTPVPGMPAALAGVANLRGVIIPMVDLRGILGVPGMGRPQPYAVVVRHGSQQIGVLVDQVPEIKQVTQGDFLAAAGRLGQEATPFVNSVFRMEERIGGVVEVPMLLSYVEAGGR